jgi:hypothetical protein
MIRLVRLASIIASLCAPLVLLGSARGQEVDAAAVSAGDAGVPLDGAPAPSVETPDATPPDAVPAAPAPAEVVLPETMTGVVAAPPPATDVEAPSFGRRGQLVISGHTAVSVSSSSHSATGDTETFAAFAPSLAYFVAKNVSVGLAANASYAQSSSNLAETKSTSLSIGPTLGLNVPFGERFSWYPQLMVGFEWIDDEILTGPTLSGGFAFANPSTTQLGAYLEVYAPVLFHATDHFFLGFGPVLFLDAGTVSGAPTADGPRTEISTDFVVGGYWGGEPASAAAPARSTAPPPRFGEVGQFVLTNDLNLTVDWTTYTASGATTLTTLIGGSAEYFVFNNFAAGLSADISGASFQGSGIAVTPNGGTSPTPVTTSRTQLSFGPILSANFAISRFFTIFPRVSLVVAHARYDEPAGSANGDSTNDIVSLSLYVPLLVHPAPHIFIGFGPSASHELSDSVSFPSQPLAPSVQNRTTTWGARLVVGGWL